MNHTAPLYAICAVLLITATALPGCSDDTTSTTNTTDRAQVDQAPPQTPRYAWTSFSFRPMRTPPGSEQPIADSQIALDAAYQHLEQTPSAFANDLASTPTRLLTPGNHQIQIWYEAAEPISKEDQLVLIREANETINNFVDNWYKQLIEARLSDIRLEGEQLALTLRQAQTQMRAFRESIRGIPLTNELRDKQLRYTRTFDQAQQAKAEYDTLVEWLNAELQRGPRFVKRNK